MDGAIVTASSGRESFSPPMIGAVLKTNSAAKRRRVLLHALVLLSMPLAGVALWAAYVLSTDNFHAIIPGEAYRAGQMSSNELVHCLNRHGIRSVINLRGENPKQDWYQDEVAAVEAAGAVHRNLSLSSRRSVPPRKTDELVKMLKELPKPVLIHCAGGADRVAFAAALYKAEIAGQPGEIAERQFSMWYGYLPFVWKEKARLRDSFRAYTRNVHEVSGLMLPPRAADIQGVEAPR